MLSSDPYSSAMVPFIRTHPRWEQLNDKLSLCMGCRGLNAEDKMGNRSLRSVMLMKSCSWINIMFLSTPMHANVKAIMDMLVCSCVATSTLLAESEQHSDAQNCNGFMSSSSSCAPSAISSSIHFLPFSCSWFRIHFHACFITIRLLFISFPHRDALSELDIELYVKFCSLRSESHNTTFLNSMSAGDFVHFRIERECDISSSSSHGSASSGSTLASINYGTIFTALQDVAQERYFPYLPDHLISDAIKDAHELVEAFITKSDSEENEVNTSIPLALRPLSFNGNKYLVEQGKFVRSNPIAENSLRLIMHETDDSKFCSLTFPHRYVLWKWFYVLRMLLRVWREECSIDDVSNYQATSDTSSTNAADSLNLRVPGVSISMNGLSYDGGSGAKLAKGAGGGLMAESVTAALDVAKAFRISIDGGRSIDLTNLKAIVIAADCYAETGISLQFGFDHFDINDTTSAEKKRPSLTGSLQIGTMVSSVAQLAEEATLGTAKRAKNVVKNTASILATSIGASKHAEENGSSFFTSRQRDYFLLKYLSGNQFVEVKKTDSFSESEYFQLDCFVPTSKMMANVIRFPFERCDALLFLYKAGIPQPVAAKVLEYEEIENWSKLSRDQLPAREMDRVSRLMNDFNNPLREVCSTVNINMDANIGTVALFIILAALSSASNPSLFAPQIFVSPSSEQKAFLPSLRQPHPLFP